MGSAVSSLISLVIDFLLMHIHSVRLTLYRLDLPSHHNYCFTDTSLLLNHKYKCNLFDVFHNQNYLIERESWSYSVAILMECIHCNSIPWRLRSNYGGGVVCWGSSKMEENLTARSGRSVLFWEAPSTQWMWWEGGEWSSVMVNTLPPPPPMWDTLTALGSCCQTLWSTLPTPSRPLTSKLTNALMCNINPTMCNDLYNVKSLLFSSLLFSSLLFSSLLFSSLLFSSLLFSSLLLWTQW